MKQLKRAAYLFCAVMFLLIMAGQVFASEIVNPDKDVTLTITSIWDQKSIPGMEYELYLVSTFDENGKLTPSAEFRTYAQKLDIKGKNDEAWHTLAQELDDAFIAGKISAQPADAVTSNENGITKFPSQGKKLVKGLYLLRGTSVEYDGFVYTTAPSFISLPRFDMDGQDWEYDVSISPKIARKSLREDLKVIKVWDDNGKTTKRPNTITIRLKRDGVEHDVITLPKNGRWEYTWEDLETRYHWTVEEDKVEGYKDPSITRDGNVFKVVNTIKSSSTSTPTPKPTLPQTGQLWWPVPILICFGLLLVIIGMIRRKEEMYDA